MLNKNRSVSLTLLLTLFTIFALASSVTALSHASSPVSRRDHTTLKRFVKKRADSSSTNNGGLAGAVGQLIGAGSDPSTDPSTNGTDTSSSNNTSTSTPASNSATNTTAPTSSTTTTTTSGVTTTTTTAANSTSTTATSSSTATSSQTAQSSQTTDAASSIPNSPSSVQVTSTLTETQQTAAGASETSAAPSTSNGGLSSSGKTTLVTVIIVVAVSVGAVALIWTVFRKWKLGSSKKFDQRLQPISWEPTVDDGIVPQRPTDAASIRSGSEGHLGRGLEHDFTAGPSHLAPVGGYADLSRGPSPQPYMQEALSRGPSLTRPNYDASVPLHHQNNYGVQDSYGRY